MSDAAIWTCLLKQFINLHTPGQYTGCIYKTTRDLVDFDGE